MEKYKLVLVAHPDDETIFCGGAIQRRHGGAKIPWRVICVTDANADGQGRSRQRDFRKACEALKVRDVEWWGFPDIYERRLPVDTLVERLRALPTPNEIFTHGPFGEYGHPHHQDVCLAAHRAFEGHPRLYSVAYNTFPELRIALTAKEYETKLRVLTNIYGSETTRFLHLLPATSSEGFLRLSLAEVSAIHAHLAEGRALKTASLKHYRPLIEFLKNHRNLPRPF
jgi:LmbE family N-acetylglucosaminyl deacetylase